VPSVFVEQIISGSLKEENGVKGLVFYRCFETWSGVGDPKKPGDIRTLAPL